MIKVDVHMHLYESVQVGEWWKAGYEIWEYGPKQDVRFSRCSGTVEDAVEAMEAAGFSHGVVVNLFAMELSREEAIASLPAELDEEARARAVAEIEATMPDRLRGLNRWLCDALETRQQLTPFVAADPWALSPEENVQHLQEMADRGARGIKIHPAVQRFQPADSRMLPVYAACRDLGMAVLAHTGSSRGPDQYAEPAAFAELLGQFPDLTVVLAHLGGGGWRQTVELAEAFPRALFDLCEIIEWAGAPNAPTREGLARMIKDVGSERVLLGTDFPWYDLDRTADQVMSLPLLSEDEKLNILGANAIRILGLPV